MLKVKFFVLLSIIGASIQPADASVGLLHSAQMPVDSSYDFDLHPKMVRLMSRFNAVVSPIIDERIGVCHLTNLAEEGSPLHHFLEWCLQEEAKKLTNLPIHGALINKGGVRADLKSGELFVRDIFYLIPFENEMVIIELKGSLLMKIVQQVKSYSSIAKIPIKPMDPNAIFRLVTLDYLAEGNGGITLLKQAERMIPLPMKARDACIRQIKAMTIENQTIKLYSPGAKTDEP